ncbi:MAG: beta-lactamase family protein [Caulobacteraceae bacterium]|nr:beta-lactamase family protein [Caulobacteraceae bacterium]
MKHVALAIGLALAPIGLAGGASAADAASGEAAADFSAVTDYMDAGYRSLGLPGASLLVVQDDKVLYERYFGDYTPDTVVPIASSSKWLSAAVIMTLVDEGKIDLDARISKYLPNFTGQKGEMTIRQMFSHTSGLVDFDEWPRWDYSISMAQYADRVAREGVMAAAPGTEVRYASASMQVVGAVAEKVTGKPWNELFKERIAIPCDMPHTTYVRAPGTTRAPVDAPLAEVRNPMLAGSARSSLRDYGHFLRMIADGGVCNGKRVLSEKAIREMQKDQTGPLPLERASNDRMGRASHYGLGEWLDVQDKDGRTVQVSSPGAFGFRPWLNLDRDLYAVFMMQRKVGGPAVSETFDPWRLIDLVNETVDAAKK